MSYKNLIVELRQMRGTAGIAAYERATKMMSVFNDAEFLSTEAAGDIHKAIRLMDDLCQDMALDFSELRALLKYRPKRDQWKDGKLKTMYDEVVSEMGRELAASRKPKTEKQDRDMRLAEMRKKLSEVLAENKLLKKRCSTLEGQLATVMKIVSTATAPVKRNGRGGRRS